MTAALSGPISPTRWASMMRARSWGRANSAGVVDRSWPPATRNTEPVPSHAVAGMGMRRCGCPSHGGVSRVATAVLGCSHFASTRQRG